MTFKTGETSPHQTALRLRWREHELVLVTILSVLSIAGNAWHMLNTPSAALNTWYGEQFLKNNLPFSYLVNIWLPDAVLVVLLYLCYLQLNFFILPRLLQTDAPVRGSFNVRFAREGGIEMKGDSGLVLKRTLVAVLCTVLLWLFLGAGWGITTYYREMYVYVQPDIEVDSRQMLLGLGLKNAFFVIIPYLLYGALRETVIKGISGDVQWVGFRTRFANQVTTWLVIYFSFFFFLQSFYILDERGPNVFFLSIIPPFVLAFLSNLYWLFPLKGKNSLFKGPYLRRLLWSTFFCTFPFAVIATLLADRPGGIVFLFLFWGWLLQLVLMTPISLLIYHWRKEKILRFRGLEIALDQSQADLQFLRSQINPHFLFNSLNTLYGTALQENAPRSAEGIQKLGDMMRFMLHENNQEKIPMYKELEYLRNYIDLQKLRTQSSPSILIEAEIEGEPCLHMIAPMLLIPFVENAFKHGISLQERSWVKVHLHCNKWGLLFEVRNSIHEHKEQEEEDKEKSGIGMKNVLHRLRLVYPDKHEFFVNANEKEFFVQLEIQLG